MSDMSQTPNSSSGSSSGIVTMIISIFAILLLLFFMVAALNFMGLVPLKKIAPGVFDWLPVNNATSENLPSDDQTANNPFQDPNSNVVDAEAVKNASISTSSKRSDYSFTISDEKAILESVKKTNLFGKIYTLDGASSVVPVDELEMVLVNEQSTHNAYSDDQGIYQSTQFVVSEGKITANIYVADRVLSSPENTDNLLKMAILSSIYRLANRIDSEEEAQEAGANTQNIISDLPERPNGYFVVSAR